MMKEGFATAINHFIVVVFDLFLLDLCVEIKHITSLGVPMNFHHEGSSIRKQFGHFLLHLIDLSNVITFECKMCTSLFLTWTFSIVFGRIRVGSTAR